MENTRILIAAEDPYTSAELEISLKSLGYSQIVLVDSGDAIINLADQEKPDLILMDLELKGPIKGGDAAGIILSKSDVPIIFCLYDRDIDQIEKDKIPTSYGFLIKPIRDQAVKVTVEMALRMASMEAERRLAEDTYQHMFMNSQVGMFRSSIGDGYLVDCNDRLAHLFGYQNREEMLSDNFNIIDRYVDPGTRERMASELIAKGQISSFEARFYRNDSSIMWVRYSGNLIPEKDWFHGVAEECTEIKEAQEELRLSQLKMKNFMDSAVDASTLWDTELNLVDMNLAALALSPPGTLKEDLVGKNIRTLVPGIEERGRLEAYRKVMETGVPHHYETDEVNLSYGKMHLYVRVFKVDDGLGITASDISEQKKAEEKIIQLRNYLSNIINSMPSILVGVDNDGNVTQWNKATENRTGIEASDALGKTLESLFPRLAEEFNKISESIRTRSVIQERKKKVADGSKLRYEDITIYPLITNGTEGAVIRIDEVTDKVRMEEMMIQSEKMLSVGGLAAGMAHEINNPLAGMIQTANVMKERLINISMQANQKVAESIGIDLRDIKTYMETRGIPTMIDAINESGQRVSEIVSNMLSFARKSDDQKSSHYLPQLLDKTLELAAADYSLKKHYDFKKVQIVKEYEEHIPPVPCEGAKIQQVILNILSNGAQSMQKSGTINPTFILRIGFEKERKRICLEIEDNGPGMDEFTRKRVFEPFFTTKSAGLGTGLGLSVSYFIITENHGGEMVVESEPGKGAKFIIKLPTGGKPRKKAGDRD